MAGEILSSTTSSDQEKFLAADLIRRSYNKLVMGAMMDKVQMKEGAGLVANFVRYKRMNVPLVPLADDGADPANSSFSLDTVSVTLDEWGDVITVTNRAQLTTKHPLIQQATELLADNAARVMDREITLVCLAGTNVMYPGTATSRATIGASDKLTDTVLLKAKQTLFNQGAPPRGGPAGDSIQSAAQGSVFAGNAYIAVCGVEVLNDIMGSSTSLGTWASVAMYHNQKALYNSEVGTWLNFRFVESNFLPRFQMLGNNTTAVATGNRFGTTAPSTPTVSAVATGGALPATTGYFFKVTAIDLLRGFEEFISIEHTMTSAGGVGVNSFTFNFTGCTAGYVFNVYFGASTGDANLFLVNATPVAVGTTVTVTATPATINPPASNNATGPVSTTYPIFIFAQKAANWVGFYGIRSYITQDISIPGNVLRRRRSIGYAFFGKAMIRDQQRLLRIECTSTFL